MYRHCESRKARGNLPVCFFSEISEFREMSEFRDWRITKLLIFPILPKFSISCAKALFLLQI